jgi:hypothetical protein
VSFFDFDASRSDYDPMVDSENFFQNMFAANERSLNQSLMQEQMEANARMIADQQMLMNDMLYWSQNRRGY